jgi:hypothetical protein
MVRTVGGIVAGVVSWFVVALGIAAVLRTLDPALSASLAAHATVATMAGRLAISFVGSLVGGVLAALIAGRGSHAALIAGVILLAVWGTYHVTMIWSQFPVWYHLTFFVSLPLLSYVGGRMRR